MQNIYKNLYIGSAEDFEELRNDKDWFFIQVSNVFYEDILAKSNKTNVSPYFIEDKDNNRIAFNLVDYGDKDLILHQIIDKALVSIEESLAKHDNVLVHCAFGRSRSASTVMLYLAIYTNILSFTNFEELEKSFKEIYNNYSPTSGIRDYIKAHLKGYLENFKKTGSYR